MNVASVAVPSVTHAATDRAGLADKVTLRDLNFYYGDARALKSISLSLYQNKVTAFIGPSAAASRRCCAWLNRMYDLYPNSAPPRSRSMASTFCRRAGSQSAARGIGMVFQKARRRFRCRSTRTSPSASGSMSGCPKSELDGRVETSLRRAGCDEVKDKLGANGQSWSGASQQRCASAPHRLGRPEVILFDEPCSALDPI